MGARSSREGDTCADLRAGKSRNPETGKPEGKAMVLHRKDPRPDFAAHNAGSTCFPSRSDSKALPKAKWVNPFVHFPLGTVPLMCSYLDSVDYRKFVVLELAPRKEECMILLHSSSGTELPVSALRVPPAKERPGFALPENILPFSLTEPEKVASALQEHLRSVHLWNVSIVAVILDGRNITDDVSCLRAIISLIETTLEHLTHLIIVVGGVSSFFASGTDPMTSMSKDARCRAHRASIHEILDRIPSINVSSDGDCCDDVLSAFPFAAPCHLESIVMPLCDNDEKSWGWYHRAVPPTDGPKDARLHLLASITQKEGDFLKKGNPEEIACMRWISFLYYTRTCTDDTGALPLHFAECERIVAIRVPTPGVMDVLSLPRGPSVLEVLEITPVSDPRSPLRLLPLITNKSVFPRLQRLKLAGFVASDALDCERFPALRWVGGNSPSASGPFVDYDLSGLKNITYDAAHTRIGKLDKIPSFSLGHLSICHGGFYHCKIPSEFRAILARFSRVHIGILAEADLDYLYKGLHGRLPMMQKYVATAHLQRLKISGLFQLQGTITFGCCPALEKLELEHIGTTLDGAHFPQLRHLCVNGGAVKMTGDFRELRSITFAEMECRGDFHFKAMQLQEISFLSVTGANLVSIGRRKFPQLRMITVAHQLSHSILTVHGIPIFMADAELDCEPPMTLHLNFGADSDALTRWKKAHPHWLISRPGRQHWISRFNPSAL